MKVNRKNEKEPNFSILYGEVRFFRFEIIMRNFLYISHIFIMLPSLSSHVYVLQSYVSKVKGGHTFFTYFKTKDRWW
ncbi:hypothetical protein BK731_02005 [Bacillus thuringiensis serovar muju]|uniref:Uncharacterized protein n=1 Tax=Bacillus cereus TaxID=1396 RepID=A0A1Q4L6K3_BACCE|nr:hypothetical protein [Bacillus thuringiensis]OKA33854.1 hypothetical protein BJR07_25805 [Bacillus cereus]OKA34009.1 hypothetical protein BJR06_21500 [Bacillus cereus]OTY09957.1 hypothetical protein BK731_02005 [Bacillus thuringiensis serovar muju]